MSGRFGQDAVGQSPFQYAKECFLSGRSPNITIVEAAGSFFLGDGDWNILPGGKSFPARYAAENERSKVLDRARKFIK